MGRSVRFLRGYAAGQSALSERLLSDKFSGIVAGSIPCPESPMQTMPNNAPVPVVSVVEWEEHEDVRSNLHGISETEFGGTTIRTGITPAGRMVVLLNTMDGGYAVIGSV